MDKDFQYVLHAFAIIFVLLALQTGIIHIQNDVERKKRWLGILPFVSIVVYAAIAIILNWTVPDRLFFYGPPSLVLFLNLKARGICSHCGLLLSKYIRSKQLTQYCAKCGARTMWADAEKK